ncbi:MAG: hypothetical protein GKR95_05585 [Gammaproteobacteria bacterium]|nr:hypothetical protein [Gammaproteobacteria bacterium]
MNGASESMAGYEWEVRVEQSTTPNTDIVRIDVSASLNQTEGYGSLFYYKANLNQRSNDN